MADIDDVIKGLECCTGLGCHHGCKYLNNGCNQFLKMDALELLTSQYAEIKRLKDMLEKRQKKWKPVNSRGNYICGRCGAALHTAIVDPMIQYCDHCGYEVEWTGGGEKK